MKKIKYVFRHGDIYKIGQTEFYLIRCHDNCECGGWLLSELKKSWWNKVNADIGFKGVDLAYLLFTIKAKKIKEGYCLKRTYYLKLSKIKRKKEKK